MPPQAATRRSSRQVQTPPRLQQPQTSSHVHDMAPGERGTEAAPTEQAQPLVAPTSAMRGVRGAAATRKTDAAVAATTPTAAATLSDAHAFDHRVPTVHSSEAEELFCCCSWSNQWARLRPCIARSPTPWWRHEPCGFRSCSERLARRMHSHSQSPGPESVPSRHWGSTPHWVGLRARRFNASAGLYTPSVSSGASNYARSDFDCHSCVLTATYLL